MSAYYNEHDRFAAAWLRELIADGLIAPGFVDERDIQDVQHGDLAGYDQHHFFAGIGGWSLALRLAGWPDDRPVWTGSCPCQPFSSAGKGQGFDDPRHLWPAWFRLIRECRPATVFGEQVASADGLAWFDTVSTDLEAEAYAIGAADLCAAGVGAPHRRQRLWFVADAGSDGRGEREHSGNLVRPPGQESRHESGVVTDSAMRQRSNDSGGMVDADQPGPQGRPGGAEGEGSTAPAPDPWDGMLWLPCRDGKARPAKSGLFPLAHGVSNRVGTLRGAGNAIVPQVAAEFIAAWREAVGE